MATPSDKIQDLLRRLDAIQHRQNQLQQDIRDLQREIRQMDAEEAPKPSTPVATSKTASIKPAADPAPDDVKKPRWTRITLSQKTGLDWEKFIGENLISKIGILITVIGVAFGAKYAIDHELISPLTRIVMGYLAGIGLTGIAMRLKEKYENFSAVLLSGGLAVLYIITYFAYNYYTLLPQTVAFLLMVIFTGFAVLAAWHYNRQIIALMGLVGAYGVPFLLGEKSGSATVLLAYMTLINTGILFIAFRKYWKPLFATAFWLSWLIFSWWMLFGYEREQHFWTALFFNLAFFLLFYGTILAYKLIKKESYRWTDIMLLLTNSFIFFGFGYNILEDHHTGAQLLGVFTLINAGIHFAVGRMIYRDQLVDRNLFYFIIGLVIVFLTIAVPVQLDGNWVTLLWAAEAVLLFWLGRSRNVPAFEKMSFPLLQLAFISLLQDWSVSYNQGFYGEPETWLKPIFNAQLPGSLLVCGIFGLMTWMMGGERYPSALPEKSLWRQGLRFAVPAIFLLALYFTFRMEIDYYFRMRSNLAIDRLPDTATSNYSVYEHLGSIWGIYYSLVFLAVLSLINMRWIKNKTLGVINLCLNACALFFFLVGGLFSLNLLDDGYVLTPDGEVIISSGYSYLRYLGYALVAGLLYITYRYQALDLIPLRRKWPFDTLLHLITLVLVSYELVHQLTAAGAEDATKLGLSILWGVYALFLIGLGIAQRKAYLRISAIALFTITLIKLFFYDIVHLSTMSKTVVLLALGVLLLLISFLYNKFKHLIADEDEGEVEKA